MLNFDNKSRFVIERVLERGDINDIRELRRYYGDSKVVSVLKDSKWLDYEVYVFAKNLFNLQPQDFQCYTLNQSTPMPWKY
jgi:hypothetical protein